MDRASRLAAMNSSNWIKWPEALARKSDVLCVRLLNDGPPALIQKTIKTFPI